MSYNGERDGQQFGNYRLTQLLGRGNFADVYRGQHVHLNTQVAIKVLHGLLTKPGRSVATALVNAWTPERRTDLY